jgi:hypothetical protein
VLKPLLSNTEPENAMHSITAALVAKSVAYFERAGRSVDATIVAAVSPVLIGRNYSTATEAAAVVQSELWGAGAVR